MKKRLLVLFITILLVALGATALAEGLAPDGPKDFMTWTEIGTMAGVIALTLIIVQVLKLPLDKLWKIPTDVFVYLVALLLMLLAQAFMPDGGGLTLDKVFLSMVNAFIAAFSAMGLYRKTFEKIEKKNE